MSRLFYLSRSSVRSVVLLRSWSSRSCRIVLCLRGTIICVREKSLSWKRVACISQPNSLATSTWCCRRWIENREALPFDVYPLDMFVQPTPFIRHNTPPKVCWFYPAAREVHDKPVVNPVKFFLQGIVFLSASCSKRGRQFFIRADIFKACSGEFIAFAR